MVSVAARDVLSLGLPPKDRSGLNEAARFDVPACCPMCCWLPTCPACVDMPLCCAPCIEGCTPCGNCPDGVLWLMCGVCPCSGATGCCCCGWWCL